MNRTIIGTLAATGLLASVIAANWATTRYGFIPVGFGLTATAGTVAIGFSLVLRDATQDALGRVAVLTVVAIGAVVSYLIADPYIAIASAVAFGVSELANYLVYTPLRNKSRIGDRRWAIAVVAASLVGAVVDTVLFLGIAFGAAAIAPALLGQLVGKGWATIAYLVIGKAASALPGKSLNASGA